MEEQPDKLIPVAPWGKGGPKTPEYKKLAKVWFLEELPRCHTVTFACEYASISPDTAYKWKEQDKNFSDAWDRAVERIHDIARQSIFQRGILGYEERAISNGMPVHEYEPDIDESTGEQNRDERGKLMWKRGDPVMIRKYSDSLAALYARANLPEYKEKQQLDINLRMAEEAEKAKESLLASLGAAVDEDSKASPQG